MNSALHSSIGLPSSSTSASRMLSFLIPPDVSSALKFSPAPCYRRPLPHPTPTKCLQITTPSAPSPVPLARERHPGPFDRCIAQVVVVEYVRIKVEAVRPDHRPAFSSSGSEQLGIFADRPNHRSASLQERPDIHGLPG